MGASHVCGTDGAFAGGACEANQCTEGLTIENSPTECAGTTGEECEYACDEGYVVGGGQHECGDDGAFAGGGCVEGEEAACTSVSNCSELGWGAGRGNPNVCGASNHLHDGVRVLEDATCFGGDDDDTDGYTHVAAVCVGGGARLCTVAELTAQETRGIGCGHDNQQVWSSDPCDGGFMSARGQRGQNPTCQTDLGTSLAVRCCTDAEVGSGDVACWAEAYEGPPPPPAE